MTRLCIYCNKTFVSLKGRGDAQRITCGSESCKKQYAKIYMKAYRKTHKKEIALQEKAYRSTHKQSTNEYCKRKLITDKNFAIRVRIRKRFYKALKAQNLNKDKQIELYGICIQDIINHLGPCPGNRNDYHIDHILPVSSFNLSKEEEIRKAFAPENHQWLTKKENQSKKDRIG